MFKIITGAVTAALLIGAAAVHLSFSTVEASSPPAAVKGDRLDIRPLGTECSQRAWPHYESHCVRDRNRPGGKAREVRIVALHLSITQ
jgi:hypothetical protein